MDDHTMLSDVRKYHNQHDVYVVMTAPPGRPWKPDLQGKFSRIPADITWLMSPRVNPAHQDYSFTTIDHVEPETLSRVHGYRYLGSFKYSEADADDDIEMSWLILSYVSSRDWYTFRRDDMLQSSPTIFGLKGTVWKNLSDHPHNADASGEAMLERHVYRIRIFSSPSRNLGHVGADKYTYVYKWVDTLSTRGDLMSSWERSLATAILDAQQSSGVMILVHGASDFEMECLRAEWAKGKVVQNVSRFSLDKHIRLWLRLVEPTR